MDNDFDENLYGVLDAKLQSFRFKFFCPTDKAAEREFGDAVNNPKTLFSSHPEDYSLYLLGKFDTHSGLVEAIVPSVLLGRAEEFLNLTPVNPSEVSQ